MLSIRRESQLARQSVDKLWKNSQDLRALLNERMGQIQAEEQKLSEALAAEDIDDAYLTKKSLWRLRIGHTMMRKSLSEIIEEVRKREYIIADIDI